MLQMAYEASDITFREMVVLYIYPELPMSSNTAAEDDASQTSSDLELQRSVMAEARSQVEPVTPRLQSEG